MLIKAASMIPKHLMTAKKALRRYIQGFQWEKRGIKLRGGFRSKEEEQEFQQQADRKLEEIKQSLFILSVIQRMEGVGKHKHF